MPRWNPSPLTPYYFTTCILVLKFANKAVCFEEIQDSHFPRKRGILVLTSVNLEKKGLILMSVFYCENGVHLGWKVIVLAKKRVNFGLKSQCFITKKGSLWAEKLVFCRIKGGNFQTAEQEWVPRFPVIEGAGGGTFRKVQIIKCWLGDKEVT